VFGFADLYQVNVTANGESNVAGGQLVSGNYFSALGIRPAVGRLITPADDRADAAEAVAVISHAFWQQRFGARDDIVGTTILVNRTPTVVVGVAPRGFYGTGQVGETADLSVPLMLRERYVRRGTGAPGQTADGELNPSDPRYWWVSVMARLDRSTPATLQPDIERVIRSTVDATRTTAAAREPFRVLVEPGARGLPEMRGELVQPLATMGAIVAVVIVIACANLATLLLARGVARDHEIAIRQALGASRARLVRALMVESLMIGAAGGVVGLVATPWIAGTLAPALALGPAAPLHGGGTGSLLAFACAIAVVTSLLFGLLPAWRGTDVQATGAMAAGTGRVARAVPRLRAARAILVCQVAMSLVVMVAAGLLVGTLRNLARVPPGFDADRVLLFRVDPSLNGYSQAERRRLLSEILDRVRTLPGVQTASLSHHALLSRSSSISTVRRADGAALPQPVMVNRLIIDEQFFATMRIPVLAGAVRFSGDDEAAVRPVVVNRAFAKRAFGTVSGAVGHEFRSSDRPGQPAYQVVAVVEDVRLARLRQEPPPTAYFSYRQERIDRASFALRAEHAVASLVPAVRQTVAAVAPDLPVDRVVSQSEQIEEGFNQERLFATLASALGALALCLACIGIYALMAYAVSRRTAEIGIRLTLGAAPRRILWMVAGEAGRIVGAGTLLGLGGGFLVSRYLESLLFGLKPTDPRVQVGGVILLVLVAGTAALVPARRAARTDPLAALRHE
jgi:predicted permease